MKTIFVLLWIELGCWFTVWAQPSQLSRAELPLNRELSQYQVWPQPDSTVFVLNYEDYFRRNNDMAYLYKFNQELSLLWQKPIHLPRGSKFLQAIASFKTLFLFFATDKRAEYILLSISLQNGEQTQNRHTLPENMTFTLTGMQVLQEKIFLTGRQDDRVTVLQLDPDRAEIWKIPAIYDQSSALASFTADTVSNRMEFILSESNGLKARLQIKRLSPEGQLYSTSFLQSADQDFLSGMLTPGDSSSKMLAGTYSLRDMRYPQGFFSGPLLPKANQKVQFFDFTTFSHFFDYMRPGRQEKIRRKLKRFRLSRKTYLLRQRFLLHDLYLHQDGFILAGEQYYPRYEGDASANRVFNGYGFSQVVVAAFDARGNLKWQNSYPLDNVHEMELQQITAGGVDKDRIIFCYPDEDIIHYKIIAGNESSSNGLSTKITPVLPQEKILTTGIDGVKHWHGSHFLVFGEQKIRNSAGVRSVFFLNKLSF